METFADWFKRTYGEMGTEQEALAAKAAWDYQQAAISKLEALLERRNMDVKVLEEECFQLMNDTENNGDMEYLT